MSATNLTFVGASWFTGVPDLNYAGIWAIENGLVSEDQACSTVPGYENPCPDKEETGKKETLNCTSLQTERD